MLSTKELRTMIDEVEAAHEDGLSLVIVAKPSTSPATPGSPRMDYSLEPPEYEYGDDSFLVWDGRMTSIEAPDALENRNFRDIVADQLHEKAMRKVQEFQKETVRVLAKFEDQGFTPVYDSETGAWTVIREVPNLGGLDDVTRDAMQEVYIEQEPTIITSTIEEEGFSASVAEKPSKKFIDFLTGK